MKLWYPFKDEWYIIIHLEVVIYKGEIHDKNWTVGNWLVQLYDNYGFQPWVVFLRGKLFIS